MNSDNRVRKRARQTITKDCAVHVMTESETTMSNRANIIGSKVRIRNSTVEKDVYIYEDHRTILQVLYSAIQEKKVTLPVNLVFFDYHADDKPILENQPIQTLLRQYRKQLPAEREFWSFVEWDCDTLDGDWLKIGMEIGLIENAIVVGCRSSNSAAVTPDPYKDHTGQIHHIYNPGHLWGDWLQNIGKAQVYSATWPLIGWKLNQGQFDFDDSAALPRPLLLDFDLDCFSVPGPEGGQRHIPWPTDQLFELFDRPLQNSVSHLNCGKFLQALAARASMITIARESEYCGGFRASASLLQALDVLLFNGLLD